MGSPAMLTTDDVISIVTGTPSGRRHELWAGIIQAIQAKTVLEVGVWRGEFAEYILKHCTSVTRYYMLDPWRHLERWNKPSNVDQQAFDKIFEQAMGRSQFATERRMVLRGTTTEKIEEIPDGTLDVAYIDGDHTLRGIAIDLIRAYPKIRTGGILGGDDYTPSIWQHSEEFEPSLVCPFAAYFAESQGAPIAVLPHNQFAIVKPTRPGCQFRIIDTTQAYGELTLLSQMRPQD